MHPRARIRTLLASDDGTFNLSSIIIGAVLVLGLVAGLTVGLTRLLPWGQDMNAKEDLSAVRTAESVTRAKDGRFLDDAGLKAAGLLDVEDRAVVGTNAEGTCYVAIAKSRSGKFFFTTDTNSGYQELLATTSTGDCLPLVDEEQLRMVIGAPTQSFGPVENGSFEEGLTGWTAGSIGGGAPATVPLAQDTNSSDVRDGRRSAELPPGSYVEQGIRVPAGAAKLTYWAKTRSGYTSTKAQTTVELYDRSGAFIEEARTTAMAGGSFTKIDADLSPVAGQDVKARIILPAGQANVISLRLDEVSTSTGAPAAPTEVLGYTRDSGATIIWDEPAFGAGSVTGYIGTAYRGDDKASEVFIPGARPEPTATFTGLENGVSYTFTVKAVNAVGVSPEGPKSDPYLVEPAVISNFSFEGKFAGWRIGNTSGGELPAITATTVANAKYWDQKYYAVLREGGYVEQTVTVPNDDGMVRLRMTAAGKGRYSNSTATIDVHVLTPAGDLLAVIPADKAVGSTPTEIAAEMTAFRGQTVIIRLAYRSVSSAASLELDALNFHAGPTPAPTLTNAWASDRTAHLEWAAPAYGAQSIKEYQVTAYDGSTAVDTRTYPGTALAGDFPGLVNGKTYTFRVKTVNGKGASTESPVYKAITVDDYIVYNGKFEGGLRGWDVTASTEGNLPTTDIGTGAVVYDRAAVNLPRRSSAIQTIVDIPAAAGASLTLRHRLTVGDSTARGELNVAVLDASGTVLKQTAPATRSSWQLLTFDVSEFAGQQITLRITNSAGNHTVRVDDVLVTVR